ncbi:MAG: hypothetical protein P4L82_11915 [Ancalomicrobiaceae bacterium]|nr:hypothetical protein [Ancalomicrobiaceae bacterium]
MILIELARDIKPMAAGQSRLVPDDVARQMIANGDGINPRDRDGNKIELGAAQAEMPLVMKPYQPPRKKA